MGSLLDLIDTARTDAHFKDWRPPTPPCLTNVDELEMDFETDGLKWWKGSKIIGVAYRLPDGVTGYLPFGHRGFSHQQLSEEAVLRWLQYEVVGKKIINAHIKTEIHFARRHGIDLEAQGNKVADVQHYAALLDDHRKRFSQEELVKAYNTPTPKIHVVNGVVIDDSRMAEYHPGLVAVRAEADVQGVHELKEAMWPLLTEQELHTVRQLEERCIFPTCEMEWNAQPIDLEKLELFRNAVQQRYEATIWRIFRETGLRFNPDSGKDWEKLFQHLKIPIKDFTDTGKGSFTNEVLKKIDHPLVKAGMQAGHDADKLSKSFNKIKASVEACDGLFRYQLHQLASDEGGTVTGRYSSSAFKINKEEIGGNVQQVLAVEKDDVEYGGDYIVRELFIPGEGDYAAMDAEQIEYRIFADRANNPKVIAAYKENPRLKFHDKIQEFLRVYKPSITYKHTKNTNFMKVYGGGPVKLAFMIGDISANEMAEINRKPWKIRMQDPRLKQALEIEEIYNRELPEVKPLLALASHLAASHCTENCQNGELHPKGYRKWLDDLHRKKIPHRGYVKTETGRRQRYPNNWRLHKAFNFVCQGTGADILKTKICELHENRKWTGFLMRHTEHDEICGDARLRETKKRLEEILNHQSFDLKVPILFEVETGPNWSACDDYWRKKAARG